MLQDKARQLGVTSEDIASALNGVVDGTSITQIRDDIYLVNVIGRANARTRLDRDAAESAAVRQQRPVRAARGGRDLPLRARTAARSGAASRLPTITFKAGVLGGVQPATVVEQLKAPVARVHREAARRLSRRGRRRVEESGKGQGPIIAVVPLMLFAMATILMIQLQSFQRLFLVFAVAPLALIGVVAALLPSGAPMGFVAILGVLALIGILIRNSVILIVQIEQLRDEGRPPWEAVVEATEHRMRPILLTAAAASLALIPIAREVFWGPMAYAMMGGIIVGTVLTLLFLPALYVAWFRIEAPKEATAS